MFLAGLSQDGYFDSKLLKLFNKKLSRELELIIGT